MYGICFGILYSGYIFFFSFFDISKYIALSAETFQEVKEENIRRYILFAFCPWYSTFVKWIYELNGTIFADLSIK